MLGLDNIERVKPGGLELKDRLVAVNRVTKVTKGGRAFGFSAIVVVGDEAGTIGFGLGNQFDLTTNQKPFQIAYCIDENEWNGKVSIQLRLKSIK